MEFGKCESSFPGDGCALLTGLVDAEMAAGYKTTRSFAAERRDIEEALLTVLDSLGLKWVGELSETDIMTIRVPINDCSWGEKIEAQLVGSSTLRISSRCILPLQLYDWGKNRKNVLTIVSGIEAELDERRRLREEERTHLDAKGQEGPAADGDGSRYEDGGESERCDEGNRKDGSPAGQPRMTLEEARSILGLGGNAGREEIQTAYRMHAKRYHPDQVPPGLADDFKRLAEEKMKAINVAYDILNRACE